MLGNPSALAARQRGQAARDRLGAARGRGADGRVAARELGAAQPHAPRFARRTVTRCSRGASTTSRVQLRGCGHRFERGHRIRLALSPTYWPHAWPSPEPVTLRVRTVRAARSRSPCSTNASERAGSPTPRRRRRSARRPATARVARREVRVDHETGRHVIHDSQRVACSLPGARAPRRVRRRTRTRSPRAIRCRPSVRCMRETSSQRPGRAWSVRVDAEMTCDADSVLHHGDLLGNRGRQGAVLGDARAPDTRATSRSRPQRCPATAVSRAVHRCRASHRRLNTSRIQCR